MLCYSLAEGWITVRGGGVLVRAYWRATGDCLAGGKAGTLLETHLEPVVVKHTGSEFYYTPRRGGGTQGRDIFYKNVLAWRFKNH